MTNEGEITAKGDEGQKEMFALIIHYISTDVNFNRSRQFKVNLIYCS